MADNAGLLCHRAGSDALAHKYGGNLLIYKAAPGEGGDTPGSSRTVTINVMWDPVNWVCDIQHENHIMYGRISCSIAAGQGTPGQSSTSQVGENMFTYTLTQFPAVIDISMVFNSACVGHEYPGVTAFVIAACRREVKQHQCWVDVTSDGQGTKTVSVSVDQSGNVEIT